MKFKKIFFIPIFVLILLVFAFPGIWFLENQIQSSLNLRSIQTELESSFQKHTDFNITTRGIYFDISNGIIFNGIRFYKKEKDGNIQSILRADRLILEFSILDYFQNKPPIHSIHLQSGEWLIPIEKENTFFDFFSNFMEFNQAKQIKKESTQLSRFIIKNPVLYLNNIQVDLFESNIEKIQKIKRNSVVFNFKSKKINKKYKVLFQLKSTGLNNSNYLLEAKGHWDEDKQIKIHFQLNNMPVNQFKSLIQSSPMIPIGNLDNIQWLVISRGKLTGSGSIENYGKGVGINLQTKIWNLSSSMYISGNESIQLNAKEIEFNYNSGWMQGEQPAYLKIKLKNKNLHFEADYKNAKLHPELIKNKVATSVTKIKLNINMLPESGFVIRGLQKSGTIDLQASILHPKKFSYAIPDVSLKAKNLKTINFQSTQGDSNQNSLWIESIDFQVSKNPQTPANFKMQATLDKTKFQVQADGLFRLYRYKDKFALAPDMNVHILSQKLTYKKIQNLIWNVHKKIIYDGSRQEAPRAEDKGPLWEEKFLQSDFYITFIHETKLKIDIVLDELEPISNFPTKLEASGEFNRGLVQLKLKQTKCDECKIRFQYKLNMQRSIPRHDIQLTLQNKKNKMPFPIFTGSNIPPESYFFQYFMAGDGWLAGDILHRSFSRFELIADNFTIENQRIVNLLSYGTGIESKKFIFQNMRLKYGTDGPRVHYYLQSSHNKNSRLSSQARYKIGSTGTGSLKFMNNNDQPNRNVRIQFKKDNTWTPAI